MAEMGLAEAVAQLRREIVASMAAAKDEAVRFQIGAIELELWVQLATKAGVKGEAKWIVVSFGADASAEHTSTHKIKLTLTPMLDGEGRIAISDTVSRPG